MASWCDVESAVPDLAKAVRSRFEAHGLALLATLRRDGSPRVSGIEPLFALDELWLGMMEQSRKGIDLHHDARLALHNATVDKQVTEGDAKVSGRAVPVRPDDAGVFADFRAAFAAATGYPPPDGPFQLFRVDVTEISFVRPGGDHLVIEWWTEGDGYRRVERR